MKKRILSLLLVLLLLLPAIPAMPTEAAELPEGTANLDFSFTSIDGESVSTKSNGKPKLIVFFMPGCSRCKYTLQDFSSSSWLANGEADVCAIDFRGYTQEEIREFQETNCPEGLIQFVADDTGNATFAVYDYLHADGNTSGTIATPVVAMVDVNNNLRYVVSGRTVYASEIEADYLPNLKGGNSGDEDNTPEETKEIPPEETRAVPRTTETSPETAVTTLSAEISPVKAIPPEETREISPVKATLPEGTKAIPPEEMRIIPPAKANQAAMCRRQVLPPQPKR